MNVTGWKWGSFAIFSAERWELIHFDMVRDNELIEMMGADAKPSQGHQVMAYGFLDSGLATSLCYIFV